METTRDEMESRERGVVVRKIERGGEERDKVCACEYV